MKKIAFVIDTIDSPTGGTEKQLLLMLEKLDRAKLSPILCVLYTSEWLENHFNLCPLHLINITSYWHPAALYQFFKFVHFLKVEKIDIVHSFFKEGMRIGISAAKLARVQLVIAVRRSQSYWMTNFDLKVTKILNRWVDLIISNSNNTKIWAAEVEGFPADRIEVIHNGIDLEPFLRIPSETRRQYHSELKIPEDAAVIGIVANLRPVKAIDVFIRAAHQVQKSNPGAHFVIVGEGELEESLKQLAEDLGLAGFIHFLGRRQDIPAILSIFDIGVLSSSSESFSNTVVEYLAAGLPVVCTDAGGAREAVEDGVNGYVVHASDVSGMARGLQAILNNYEMKRLMGEISLRKAKNFFSLSTMMNKYENIYLSKGKSSEKKC